MELLSLSQKPKKIYVVFPLFQNIFCSNLLRWKKDIGYLILFPLAEIRTCLLEAGFPPPLLCLLVGPFVLKGQTISLGQLEWQGKIVCPPTIWDSVSSSQCPQLQGTFSGGLTVTASTSRDCRMGRECSFPWEIFKVSALIWLTHLRVFSCPKLITAGE